MPRLIRFTHTGPIKIEPTNPPNPTDKPIFICACGLSQKFPICDGAHKACKTTEPDPAKLYIYDQDRKTIIDVRDEPPAPPALPPSPSEPRP